MAQARRDDLHYCQLHHELASYRGLGSEIKRIIAGNEVSYLQQIQGGQQIDAEMINGIKITRAKARSSPRLRANT